MLEEYDLLRQKLLDLVKQAKDIENQVIHGSGNLDEQIKFLTEEKPSANLAVVGEWNNGKTTLINAFLGEPLLIEDIRECTAAECRLYYSEQPQIRIVKNLKDENEKVIQKENQISTGLKEYLKKYTTRFGENVEKQIDFVEIGWPCEILKQGICLIDTPGVNSVSEQRSRITYGTLTKADAILMLIDARKCKTKFDLDFIKTIKNREFDNVFFVINRIDELTNAQVKSVLNELRDEIKHIFSEPVIIPISAAAALIGYTLKNTISEVNDLKGSIPPSLKIIELDGEEYSQSHREYATKLIEFSNLTELSKTIGEYFVEHYGRKGKLKTPIRESKYAINKLLKTLEDNRLIISNDTSLKEIGQEIEKFNNKIPHYLNDKHSIIESILERFKILNSHFNENEGHNSTVVKIHKEIAERIKRTPVEKLEEEKEAIFNEIVGKSFHKYFQLNEIKTKVKECREYVDEEVSNVIQRINNGPEQQEDYQPEELRNYIRETANYRLKLDLLAAGVTGSTAAAGTLFVSTSIASTGLFGFGASLPFLASNPVGWTVAAGLLVGGIGVVVSRKLEDDNKKKERIAKQIIDYLKKARHVDKLHGDACENVRSYLKIAEKSFREFVESTIDDTVSSMKSRLKEGEKLRESIQDDVTGKLQITDCQIAELEDIKKRLEEF